MSEKLNLKFYAAGVQFRKGWKDILSNMTTNSEIKLAPEPTNRFDPFAIKITNILGEHLGYVPAKTGESKKVAIALAEEKTLVATISTLEPDFEPWTALEVVIEEV